MFTLAPDAHVFSFDPAQFILVELKHVPEGKDTLKTFLESKGYRTKLEMQYGFFFERLR